MCGGSPRPPGLEEGGGHRADPGATGVELEENEIGRVDDRKLLIEERKGAPPPEDIAVPGRLPDDHVDDLGAFSNPDEASKRIFHFPPKYHDDHAFPPEVLPETVPQRVGIHGEEIGILRRSSNAVNSERDSSDQGGWD